MPDERSMWGRDATEFFYELTPARILDAVESALGLRCTGRVLALNSMENRVYEVEIDLDEAHSTRPVASGRQESPRNAPDRFVIAKFYRPGRWTPEQILEEHQFLGELLENEVPVVAPRRLKGDSTLRQMPDTGLWYAIFPKCRGRSPDELTDEHLERVGRLLARLHNVGAAGPAPHRLRLNPDTYGIQNLKHLVDTQILPDNIKATYVQLVEEICKQSEPLFQNAKTHRIHGDCHLGNLLSGSGGLFFVDFDDMVIGPAVQDLWLLVPGRDAYAKAQLSTIIQAYEMMRPFDRQSLQLIEALRALRFIHFSAWIGRRFADPAFPRAFPDFGTERYWYGQIADLKDQLNLLTSPERQADL